MSSNFNSDMQEIMEHPEVREHALWFIHNNDTETEDKKAQSQEKPAVDVKTASDKKEDIVLPPLQAPIVLLEEDNQEVQDNNEEQEFYLESLTLSYRNLEMTENILSITSVCEFLGTSDTIKAEMTQCYTDGYSISLQAFQKFIDEVDSCLHDVHALSALFKKYHNQ